MRTITLELLRHGPAHNQLLSPLTPYLALCDNHGAVTLNLPFEHNQMLHRLDALEYASDEKSRLFQLGDTAAVMGRILGEIPGLIAAAAKPSDQGQSTTHLRLIISASELALLPFELALAPAGFPGSGQHLLLQSEMPLCMTRETRRTADEGFVWAEKPRILFAAASPPGIGDIPLQSHLLALRQAIRPWLPYFKPDDESRDERIKEHLVLLPEASIEDIESQCATGTFSHVHILAHGAKRTEGYDTRFSLALHNSRNRDETDFVSGARLAAALRGTTACGKPARPNFVSLASCDSGNVGSVAGAGSSIAHALHESGIPIVVAAQFPLTFAGSVIMVQDLYDGLLSGSDPRHLACEVRRKLFTQLGQEHDWASMTIYASLPPNIEERLPDIQISRMKASIDAAMSHADEATAHMSDAIVEEVDSSESAIGARNRSPRRSKVTASALTTRALSRISTAKARLKSLRGCIPAKKADIDGLLAGTEKREAEIIFASTNDVAASLRLLKGARDNYWRSFISDRSLYWAIVQYLALDTVVRAVQNRNETSTTAPVSDEMRPEALWKTAELMSLYDLNNQAAKVRWWARGNLIELYLLSLLPEFESCRTEDAVARAKDEAKRLVFEAGPAAYEVYSTRRQMRRYFEWFCPLFEQAKGIGVEYETVKTTARDIFKIFPATVEGKY